VIDGENYLTYCNGNGTNCSSTVWGGGSLNLRDGYNCYLPQSGGGSTGTVPAMPSGGYLLLAGVLLSVGSRGLQRERSA
jgi:hypothetical protein